MGWPGRNQFFFGGRLMTGPWIDLPFHMVLWMFLLIPSALYFMTCAPVLLSRGSYAMVSLTIILLLITIVLLLITSFSDPGIIPRRKVQRAANSEAWVNNEI